MISEEKLHWYLNFLQSCTYLSKTGASCCNTIQLNFVPLQTPKWGGLYQFKHLPTGDFPKTRLTCNNSSFISSLIKNGKSKKQLIVLYFRMNWKCRKSLGASSSSWLCLPQRLGSKAPPELLGQTAEKPSSKRAPYWSFESILGDTELETPRRLRLWVHLYWTVKATYSSNNCPKWIEKPCVKKH